MTPAPTIASADFYRWASTIKLLAALKQAEIEARFVGGCVRDALLNRPIKDVDLACITSPVETLQRLQALGFKVIPTGIEHGTVTVLVNETAFEITTLRHDVDCDGRHAIVAYTNDWSADAKRRDFTVNALYADHDGRVYDYNDGLLDLQKARLRFIGDANTRIKEDALRILRLFRFQAQLGFTVEAAVYEQCKKRVKALKHISGERIFQETLKLLATPTPTQAWHALFDYDIAAQIYDGLLSQHIEAVLAAEEALEIAALDGAGRFYLLVALADEYDVAQLKSMLKLSNQQAGILHKLIQYKMEITPDMSVNQQRKWHYLLGTQLYQLCLIAAAASSLKQHLGRSQEAYKRMMHHSKSWQPPVFEISGSDLMQMGMEPGEKMGQQLKQLETKWIDSGFALDKSALLALLT